MNDDDLLSSNSEFEDSEPEISKIKPQDSRKVANTTSKKKKKKVRNQSTPEILMRRRRKVSCTICGKIMSANSLKNHKDRVHLKLKPLHPPTNVPCKVCGKLLSSSHNLKTHMDQVHHKLKPFHHEPGVTDTGAMEKKFLCYICGKTLMTKMSLQNHVDIHLGRRRFKCNLCHRAFPSAESHTKCYKLTNTLVFTCEFCGKSFKTFNSFSRHRSYHLPEHEKPWKCPFPNCDRRFPVKRGVLQHLISSAHKLTLEEARAKAGIGDRIVERLNPENFKMFSFPLNE